MTSQEEMLEQQKQQCPFCKMVRKEIEAYVVYEDEHFLGVLDINPAVKGHVLFFPKEHYPIIATIPPPVFTEMSKNVKKVANKMENGLMCKGTDVFIASGGAAGQRTYHFALHIIPRYEGDGFSKFILDEEVFDPEKLGKTKEILAANLKKIMQGKFKAAEPLSKEQLVQFIEQNPQLKQIITEKPDHFVQLVQQNEQMQKLFKDADVQEIIEIVNGKKLNENKEEKKVEAKEKDNNHEKKESKEGKEKENEKEEEKEGEKSTELDEISDYLNEL